MHLIHSSHAFDQLVAYVSRQTVCVPRPFLACTPSNMPGCLTFFWLMAYVAPCWHSGVPTMLICILTSRSSPSYDNNLMSILYPYPCRCIHGLHHISGPNAHGRVLGKGRHHLLPMFEALACALSWAWLMPHTTDVC